MLFPVLSASNKGDHPFSANVLTLISFLLSSNSTTSAFLATANCTNSIAQKKVCGINEKDINGNTILHSAVLYLPPDRIEKLLNIDRIEVNSKANDGLTPLWRAVYQDRWACVNALLSCKEVDVNLRDIE